MGMPGLLDPITTVEELLALPDDGLRHELLDGEHVVTPAPALLHQRAVAELMYALRPFLRGRADLELFMSPADVVRPQDSRPARSLRCPGSTRPSPTKVARRGRAGARHRGSLARHSGTGSRQEA